MASQQLPQLNIDRYVVIHVATTCDEHGVYVTKDSAEVIELGWILVDANSLEEVRNTILSRPKALPQKFPCSIFSSRSYQCLRITHRLLTSLVTARLLMRASLSNPSTLQLRPSAVSFLTLIAHLFHYTYSMLHSFVQTIAQMPKPGIAGLSC